jgi:hypothetical protein
MWLWDPGPELRWQFHVFERITAGDGQFVSYEGDSSGFERFAAHLAADAAAKVLQLRHQFSGVAEVADYYRDKTGQGLAWIPRGGSFGNRRGESRGGDTI